jgi:tetratricopeptide (TPR) repeat protein
LEATLELTVPVDSTAEETEEKEIGVLAKLREARIYAEQGLFDEAEALYHEILDLDPRHNEALKGLEEVRKRREEMIVPTDPASVFQRLNLLEERTRVEEGASASSSGTMRDGRSHYELATAYRELGLLDECIEELLLATQDPNTALEANKELISCYLAKDDLDRAIIHLREVFKSTRVPKEELAKTIYPLAQALEKRGQKEKALALYKKIEQYCPAYQDVRQRIEILRQ